MSIKEAVIARLLEDTSRINVTKTYRKRRLKMTPEHIRERREYKLKSRNPTWKRKRRIKRKLWERKNKNALQRRADFLRRTMPKRTSKMSIKASVIKRLTAANTKLDAVNDKVGDVYTNMDKQGKALAGLIKQAREEGASKEAIEKMTSTLGHMRKAMVELAPVFNLLK